MVTSSRPSPVPTYEHWDVPAAFGTGPRRDPPVWARTTRFLVSHLLDKGRAFYEGAPAAEVFRARAAVACRNGEVAWIMLGESLGEGLRPILERTRAVRYGIAIEAWMSLPERAFGTEAEAEAYMRTVRPPETDPRRREVFAVLGCERSGRDEARTLELVRGAGGGVADLREIPELSSGPVRSMRAVGPLSRLF